MKKPFLSVRFVAQTIKVKVLNECFQSWITKVISRHSIELDHYQIETLSFPIGLALKTICCPNLNRRRYSDKGEDQDDLQHLWKGRNEVVQSTIEECR